MLAAALTNIHLVRNPTDAFPALTPTIVGLPGISQGGYLVYKVLPHDSSNGKSTTEVASATTSNQVPAEEAQLQLIAQTSDQK